MNALRLASVLIAAVALAAVEVPGDLARVLAAADAAATPAEAVRALAAWRGAPHALHQARLGAAWAQQQRWREAEAAWRQALALAPGLHAAGLGLAECRLRQGDAAGAIALCATHLDRGRATAAELLLYAEAARLAGDSRLHAVLIGDGIARFPASDTWRRLELAQLAATARWGEAAQAARALLARSPGDARLWQALAAAEQELGRGAAVRAALEAAVLADDRRDDLRRHLAAVQLAAGQAPAALAHYRRLLAGSDVDADGPDGDLVANAIRAAIACGEVEQAWEWFAAAPATRGDPLLALAFARLALDRAERTRARIPAAPTLAATPRTAWLAADHAQDIALAVSTLDALPALPMVGADVLLWAGQLAERLGERGRAEACYRRAALATGSAAALAPLHLAQLLHRQGRRDEAVWVLADHLERHPADATAHAFAAALGARAP